MNQPNPPASPVSATPISSTPQAGSDLGLQSGQFPQNHKRAVLVTETNSFGLFRIYDAGSTPVEDPEDQSGGASTIVSEPGVEAGISLLSKGNPFHPYPNEAAWRIGEWYWNEGVQKSKKGFESLIKIIGSEDFRPEDLRCTNWTAIDRELGGLDVHLSSHAGAEPSDHEADLDSQPWLPEEAGWMRRSITISVPFPRRSLHPGPRDYTVSDFYRRPLLSIIRDKLSNPSRCRSFRFEPYLLRWRRSPTADDIGVYGELFYSEAFISAHHEIQNMALDVDVTGGCTLPRRIVALMLWSDATHLTSFSDAKLWPLYIYFGNESKYQRCTPTANLCSHAAYFQTVSVHWT